jgi:AcrR family transcriptional regulator|tara:strand:+ start:2696 stop:3580 length:885 start_codon:yes stop_codon:yes gene_type:complete
MNAAQFQTWVKQGPNASDVSTLRELVARYPYSGVLRLWLAKASYLSEDLNRNEDLLAAGAHVPSRRALFQALMGPALLEAAQHIHREVLAAPEVTEDELVKLVWHDNEATTDEVNEAASDLAPAVKEEVPVELEEHARDAMVAAIASTLEHEVSEWTEEESQDEVQRTEGVPMPALATQAAPTSLFGRWLQQRARETGFGQDDLAERGAAALIDAFLAKGDIKIGPVRDALESTGDWAQQGLVEDPSLVTETMAKLYAQQGQMGRARKAYKLLALKYPEKSVYFAAQLKKLRNT